jgi:arylsulfatase A-like enzyme
MMTLPTPIHAVALLFCLSGPLFGADEQSLYGSRPNIVFVFSDDLSYRDLSCYGQENFQTPNLDQLASSGLRFTQAYAGSPECAPSRGSLMTGMHMGHCRSRANKSVRRKQEPLLEPDVTIAEVLKRGGYTTAFVGKWGIGLPGTEGAPDKQGFGLSYGFYNQSRAHNFFPEYIMHNGEVLWLPGNYDFDMRRLYNRSRHPVGDEKVAPFENHYDEAGKLIPFGVADPDKAVYTEDLFIAKALEFIEANEDQPFFLYYATQLPHGPVITPDLGEYKDKPWPLKNKEWAAMVRHLDTNVGMMVSLLKQLDIYDDTIILFAGDNGYSQWGYFARPAWEDDPLFRNKGPWRAGKFISQEGGVRVPFFVHWPKRIPARASDHICALYDVLPTLADLAGVKVRHKVDGISFVPELQNTPNAQESHRYLYWEGGTRSRHAQAARMGPWKGYREHPEKATELYRIESDIACEKDVATLHPDIVKEIEAIFDEAHEDSLYYINPGESDEEVALKTEKAPPMGDTTYSRPE